MRRSAGLAILACALWLTLDASIASDSRSREKPSLHFFLSGHSLTDDPLASFIEAIAKSSGFSSVQWNEQIIIGSPIRVRTNGMGSSPEAWVGYQQGKNRNGRSGLDIVGEFSNRKGSSPYDTLIVADAHASVAGLMYNDTPRYLRHYHELFISHNSAGSSFFFYPWESIKDTGNLRPWLDLERDSAKVLQCVVNRVNTSLEHERRPDRIKSIPANFALVRLFEELEGGRLNPFDASDERNRVRAFIVDDVHLTEDGFYYIALVTFISATGRNPQGAWKPQRMSIEKSGALQALAWKVVAEFEKTQPRMSLDACREFMVDSFCDKWNAYVPSKHMSVQNGCKAFFRETNGKKRNPFHFDAATDSQYWFKPIK